MNVEPLSQNFCFDLNVDYEAMIERKAINKIEVKIKGEPPNASCGFQFLQLSLSTNHPNTNHNNNEFGKAQAVKVTSVFTTDEVSTYDLSSMY